MTQACSRSESPESHVASDERARPFPSSFWTGQPASRTWFASGPVTTPFSGHGPTGWRGGRWAPRFFTLIDVLGMCVGSLLGREADSQHHEPLTLMSHQGTSWHWALGRTLGCVRNGPTATSFLGTRGQHGQMPPLSRAQNKFRGKDFSFHPGCWSGFCLQPAGQSAQPTSRLVLVLCRAELALGVSTRSVVLNVTCVYLRSFLRALCSSAWTGTATWGFSEEAGTQSLV